MAAVLIMTGCSKDDTISGEEYDGSYDDPVGKPVLFSVGNVNQTVTRADVPYMIKDGRFVCTMYYHAGVGDTDESVFDIKPKDNGGTMSTAWLKVNNDVGNSVYWNKNYNDVTDETKIDDLGFEKAATKFYWQNRLNHAFLALADYNNLTGNDGATNDQGKLKMYPNHDLDLISDPGEEGTDEQKEAYNSLISSNRYVNTYDLTKGTRTSITGQPDPILALTVMKPAGATQEANRVRLYFKHQFSLIQVNVKGDKNSADLTTGQIEKVELLGISEVGYVFSRLNKDGTVGAAQGKDVNLDSYTDAQLAENKWGTSFQMFDMATGEYDDEGHDKGYAYGFLKSFNAIAFGQLWAIRITWHEGTAADTGIVHVSTFEVPLTNEISSSSSTSSDKEVVQLRNLQSGTKYIYDLELRRGTLAVIRTQIIDWKQDKDLVYGTDGTINN